MSCNQKKPSKLSDIWAFLAGAFSTSSSAAATQDESPASGRLYNDKEYGRERLPGWRERGSPSQWG